MKNVAVIGAGVSGLCTTKELLEAGFNVVCFEKRDDIGGIFYYSSSSSEITVWQSCKLTSSAFVTSFSDFLPEIEHKHWTHSEYFQYLLSYVNVYNLRPNIKFNTLVTSVEVYETSWRVSTLNANCEETLIFDAVFLCGGIHSKPFIPNIKDLSLFKGQIVHSLVYKSNESIKGKKVLFVGAGESGSEIIQEVSKYKSECYLSLKQASTIVIPRLINGFPNDYRGTRLFYSLPKIYFRDNSISTIKCKQIIKKIFYPFYLLRSFLYGFQQFLENKYSKKAYSKETSKKIGALIRQINSNTQKNQFERFATKTEGFVEAIANGRCQLYPEIELVNKMGEIVFKDGKKLKNIDTIVFSTGYTGIEIPFLKEKGISYLNLYKGCVSTNHNNLFVIGYVRPAIGAIPPIAEMQARYTTGILKGAIKLPNQFEMRREVSLDIENRRQTFSTIFDKLPYIVDFSTYVDELAGFVGCKPNIPNYVHRPYFLYKLYTIPFSTAQYRLNGKGNKKELVEKVIKKMPSYFQVGWLFDAFISFLISLFRIKLFKFTLPISK